MTNIMTRIIVLQHDKPEMFPVMVSSLTALTNLQEEQSGKRQRKRRNPCT